jgi:DNA-binding MarR family transcriptional regulator
MKNKKLTPLTEPAVLEFLETASNLVHRLDRALSIRGMSFNEYRILSVLSETAAVGCPRIELASAVGLTPSAVTRALKPLEKLGYVISVRNNRDARQSLATIKPAGLELLNDGRSIMHELFRGLPLNALSQQKIAEFQSRLHDLQ